MCAKKVRRGGISMGSQNLRAVAARAMIVIRGPGLNNTPQTNPLRGVTYPWQNQVSKHVLHAIYDQPFRNIHSTGATQDPFFDDLYPSTTPSQASV